MSWFSGSLVQVLYPLRPRNSSVFCPPRRQKNSLQSWIRGWSGPSKLPPETTSLQGIASADLIWVWIKKKALILVLIFETRPQSPWKPYIDLLPREFDSLMFWSPQELSALRGSSVLDKIGREEADETFLQKLLPVIKVPYHTRLLPLLNKLDKFILCCREMEAYSARRAL